MLSQEDLQAIAVLLDQQLTPMRQDIAGLKEDVTGLKEDVTGLKEDVSRLKEDVAELREEGAATRAGVEQLVRWASDPVAQQGRIALDVWEQQRHA